MSSPRRAPAAARVTFNRPAAVGREAEYFAEALASRKHAGDGPFTQRCHAWLAERLGVPRVLLTTSCTHALEMSALLLALEPGDEVIVPSFAFVTTAGAFALHGATPVFVDVRPDTLNLDEARVEDAVTPRTRAIVALHYAGVGCEMDAIAEVAGRHGLTVVEDNAHGLLGRYRGRLLGTFGALATQSFHETKSFSCGEGGALLINDPSLVERAEIIREKGTDRSRFFRGQVDKYTWIDHGSSYLPSDLLAAVLLGQLEQADVIQRRREEIWRAYAAGLADWAAERGARLPITPAHCDQTFHMFYLLMPDLDSRQQLIARLAERGVGAVFHYLPLHLSAMGTRYGGRAGDCPVAEDASDRLVRLPMYNTMSEAEQEAVIEAVRGVR